MAEDDFGRPAKESGEWQVIFSDSESWMGGKELARETFRYVEGHMRERVASMAADWMKQQLRYLARRLARTATMGDERFIADQLVNAWEFNSEREMLGHLVANTKYDETKLKAVVAKWYGDVRFRMKMELARTTEWVRWLKSELR